MNIEAKRKQEHEVVRAMIEIYCRKNHHSKELCPQCQKLADYAQQRTEKCPFMAEKTFCSQCKVHCYSPKMREEIKKVMRFSGKYMLFYHPVLTIRHGIETIKAKRKEV